MAYQSMQSTFVTGGVAGEDFVEGIAVEISASGLHQELPTVMVADANSMNVFVALVPPDMFPRPTPMGMFRRPDYMEGPDPRNAFEFTVDSGQYGTYYNIGPSMLEEPTVYSGYIVQLHKGGAYAVTANCFVDSADIKVPGALIKVGTDGKWEYTADASVAVGYVREYNLRFNRLYIVLERSAK